ncbi:hypothetical protein C8J57DRAFT_1478684 [Mycena rebaudengoi]|nr:hypothetical protein C8J57DRAFT_1478684 [Mycena rebaudengoi]
MRVEGACGVAARAHAESTRPRRTRHVGARRPQIGASPLPYARAGKASYSTRRVYVPFLMISGWTRDAGREGDRKKGRNEDEGRTKTIGVGRHAESPYEHAMSQYEGAFARSQNTCAEPQHTRLADQKWVGYVDMRCGEGSGGRGRSGGGGKHDDGRGEDRPAEKQRMEGTVEEGSADVSRKLGRKVRERARAHHALHYPLRRMCAPGKRGLGMWSATYAREAQVVRWYNGENHEVCERGGGACARVWHRPQGATCITGIHQECLGSESRYLPEGCAEWLSWRMILWCASMEVAKNLKTWMDGGGKPHSKEFQRDKQKHTVRHEMAKQVFEPKSANHGVVAHVGSRPYISTRTPPPSAPPAEEPGGVAMGVQKNHANDFDGSRTMFGAVLRPLAGGTDRGLRGGLVLCREIATHGKCDFPDLGNIGSWDQKYIGGPPKQAQTSLVEVGGIIGDMGDSEMVLGAQFIIVINKDAHGAIWTAAAEEMMAHHTHNVNAEFSGTRVRRLDVLVPLNKKKITHMGGLAWEEGGEDMKRQWKTVGGQGMVREAAMGGVTG